MFPLVLQGETPVWLIQLLRKSSSDDQAIFHKMLEKLSKLFLMFIIRRADDEDTMEIDLLEIQASADFMLETLKGLGCTV